MKFIKFIIILIPFYTSLNGFSQENMLCSGHYWTEDEANINPT